ncbi:MAG TPA: GDP-mannose 4,6-dehydratase, partial [Smithellaceae bacterium]|nr:GDP-mannose 4,6-dehydratase [Smithellaceae bacterium]
KIAADQLALSYYLSFQLPVKIVRPFNTYGPRQSARAVIPTIISQLLSGGRTLKLGNIFPTRDLNFVKDTVEGFISIAGAEKLNGEVTNIGSGREISVRDLALEIARICGTEVDFAAENERMRPDGSEVERLLCDNAKITKNTNWQPQYSLTQGLTETINWMKNNMSIYKPDLYLR